MFRGNGELNKKLSDVLPSPISPTIWYCLLFIFPVSSCFRFQDLLSILSNLCNEVYNEKMKFCKNEEQMSTASSLKAECLISDYSGIGSHQSSHPKWAHIKLKREQKGSPLFLLRTITRILSFIIQGNVVIVIDLKYSILILSSRLRLVEEGYDVQVVGPKKGQVYNSKHQYWATSTLTFSEVNPTDVKVLVVPGILFTTVFNLVYVFGSKLSLQISSSGGFCTDRLRRYAECNNLVAEVWKVRFSLFSTFFSLWPSLIGWGCSGLHLPRRMGPYLCKDR